MSEETVSNEQLACNLLWEVAKQFGSPGFMKAARNELIPSTIPYIQAARREGIKDALELVSLVASYYPKSHEALDSLAQRLKERL